MLLLLRKRYHVFVVQKMGAVAVLAVWFLLLTVAVPSSNALGFKCTSARTCQSMIGYTPPSTSTMSEIKRLFNLTSTRSLIAANSLPLSTGNSYQFPAGSTVRVPFPCRCSNKTGISDRTPVYTVKEGDFLYHIAEFFDGFVTYNDIAIVNNILNASLIYGGQRLWIPLPCSCDDVDGSHVTHYGLLVASGSTLKRIAEEFGTTPETLLRVNGMSDPKSLRAGQILDVPLQGHGNNETRKKIITGHSNNQTTKKIIIGSTVGAGSLLLLCVLFYVSWIVYSRRKFSLSNPIFFLKRQTNDTCNEEAFLKNYGPLALRRYTYSELKKITSSFKDKLGQGGFGGVFKGKLHDGRLVAVKVLSETKGNGEEFINEVASIGKTYHVNIVSLLGFCIDGPKRALIYEFMPNGSLEKFIYIDKPNPLGWEKLYQITVGIARGLEYLHRGCHMRILHLDIKPHNILLDQDFCPKISDFGLSKLCLTKDSVVSMLGARGTVGYIAPEVVSRNFGGVSHKSDVYSYGMVVLEIVGGRKNLDTRVENTSEIYFPHWMYKHLHLNGDLEPYGVISEEETSIIKKTILVGLWCIQTDPRNRPSMTRVVEMLEGSPESLEMPPKPLLSSPTRSWRDTSTTLEVTATEEFISMLSSSRGF